MLIIKHNDSDNNDKNNTADEHTQCKLISLSLSLPMCIYIYMHIYIYIERERDVYIDLCYVEII